MAKQQGIIFDLLKMKNGIFLTLFRFIRIGIASDNEGQGKFLTILLAIYKLEFTTSITWRQVYGNQEKTKKSKQKSKTTVASA